MSNLEQIKPVDWAKEHGVKSDFVMKLLRDNGVKVLTQVSKVNAAEFEKIEEMADHILANDDTSQEWMYVPLDKAALVRILTASM